MSRIGKKPILIPDNVEAKIDGQKVKVSGPKGELSLDVRPELLVELKEKAIYVSLGSGNEKNKALWGLTRSLIYNMVKGVAEGYVKKLEIEGVGYKASLREKDLVLNVGFTHSVVIDAPPGISFSVEKNVVGVSGADKQMVGQTAAKIRKVKPPEPYKGTGIRYQGEVIKKKEGKKAVSTTK